MQHLKEKILKTLNQNGFPQKKVSLPTDKLFQMADDIGCSFNKIAEQFKTEGIATEIQAERTIFSMDLSSQTEPTFAPQDILKKAQEMMAGLSSEERDKLMQQYQSMSDEEKTQLMEKAKKMGLF